MQFLNLGSRMAKMARMPFVRLRNAIETPVLVLAYHRVAELKDDAIGMAVSPDNFRSQLRHLRANYPVLRFEEDWSPTTRPSIVITFDDGYADNLHHALPILEEQKIPASFFVSSGWIDSNEESWWDELENIFLGPHVLPPHLSLEAGTKEVLELGTASRKARMQAYRTLHHRMKRISKQAGDEILAKLRGWSGLGHNPRPSHRSLSLAELKTLAASRWVTIGAHTINHRMLSGLSREEQEKEIVGSRRTTETWLEKPIDVFSYPFGDRADYNQDTLEICRSAGFRKAAAAHPGQARKSTDPMRIPRCFVHNWDGPRFANKLRLFFNT